MISSAQSTKASCISVITTCYGRNDHLYNLLASLAHGSVKPDEVIIVNDDADAKQLAQYPLNIMQLPTRETSDVGQNATGKTGFDIGRNRNIGADKAAHEALIFLDVDCIVAPDFIEHISAHLRAKPDALLMGQPRYLTRPLNAVECQKLYDGKLTQETLDTLSVFNPYRHNLTESDQMIKTDDYGAFWSLCFAISRRQFQRIGGFDTDYIGYGAEDTDFAFMARDLDIEFYLTSDVIYHQQHSVYRPPLNHLSSIIINANRFYDKWQHWPMAGWLTEFADMQLIDWQVTQSRPITMIRHPNEAEITAAHCPDAPFV